MVLNRYAVENLASAALRSESKSDALMDMVSICFIYLILDMFKDLKLYECSGNKTVHY